MAHLDAKLLEWSEVQEQIEHLLKNSDPGEETSVYLPHGLQPAYSLHHPHVIRCLAFYNSTKGDVFVTHVDAGHRNEMFVWTISNLSQEQVKCVRFSINPSISKLLFVPQHRVFVGFCKDIRLSVFSDVIHNCSELSSITCATTVLCMVYNELTDELITGGHGSLQAWNMNHVEIRDPLSPAVGFECDLTSTDWVRDVRVDIKNKMLIALCDERVLLISSETRKQIYNFPNWHQTALTSFVFYRKLEYFITASMDGCIKVWNAVVYGQVHEFVGHFNCVTGLITHPSDPLLLSCSKDGTVRVWRLDTFELTYRLDYGESILGMRLANHHQVFFYTQHDVKGYNFNQFHHLFTPVQSGVHLLSRIKSSILPSRILCAAEDGGVRVISPVSGTILTMIYPMATYQVLTDLVYDISRARIYTVLTTGDVLVFSSNTNPCAPSQLWVPDMQDNSIICITLMKLDCALGRNESATSESLVFAGSKSGQIHLIESSTVIMPMPVQAHCGTVMNLQISHGDYGKGQNTIEGADRLVSSGSDKAVRIWKLEINKNLVSLACMIVVSNNCCACHVSMISNTLCMAMPNFKVHVYDLGQGSMEANGRHATEEGRHHVTEKGRQHATEEQSYRLYTHHKDNDHTRQITALCSCHRLGIFATTSDDGFVKIWDRKNTLVRELTFDGTLRGVCFANDRGDLLVGFQNHISWVNIASYLPLTYLENIVNQQFSSDANEEPVTFNPNLQLWFDIDSILPLPMELVRRKRTLNKLDDICRLSIQAVKEQETDEDEKECQSTDSQVNIAEVKSEVGLINIQETIESSATCSKPFSSKKMNSRFLPKSSHCSLQASEDECVLESSEETDFQPCASSSSVDDASKIDKDLTEDTEGEMEKQKWPIAPDGYIPNSIIRKYMRLQLQPEMVTESPWKLKPLPFIRSPDSIGKSSNSSDNYLSHAPFTWMSSSESNEELDENDILSMLSDDVASELALGVEDLLPLSSDSDTEMSTPDEVLLKRRRKTAAALIKFNKTSKKLPQQKMSKKMAMAMVLEEAIKKKEKKEPDIVIERKPSEVPDVLKLIVRMSWFLPKKLTINIFSVINALLVLLDKVGESIHGEVCKCILDIHRCFCCSNMAEQRQNEWANHTIPPTSSLAIKTIEMHTGGGPVRVIMSGYPEIFGDTLLQKGRYVKEKLDHLRKMLIFEPRGHFDKYGALLVKPDLPGADIAVLFMHNDGYTTMCGHVVISLARLAVDKKYVTHTEPETEVNIQCPCGMVKAFVEHKDGKSGGVRFHSVPAFLFASDVEVDVDGLGKIKVDISYGGAFYAFVSANTLGLDLSKARTNDVRAAATAVSNAVTKQVKLHHPVDDNMAFFHGIIVTDGHDTYSKDPTPTSVFSEIRRLTGAPVVPALQQESLYNTLKALYNWDRKESSKALPRVCLPGCPSDKQNAGTSTLLWLRCRGVGTTLGKPPSLWKRGTPLGKGSYYDK